MNIFDMFTAKPEQAPAPTPNAGPADPGNIPQPTVVTDPNNPTAPVTTPIAEVLTPPVDESPLAPFKDLWEAKPTDPNAPKLSGPVELNPEDLKTAFSKVDFSSSITPENLAAITAGGEEAAVAFQASMAAVAQTIMLQSTLVNNKLTEKAVKDALAAHTESLPELLRSQAASDHLKTSNPIFSNPAIKPIIEATQAQLLAKHPNATHSEITDMTKNFILAMGDEFAPKEAVNNNTDGNEVDWDKFMGPQ